MNIGRLPGRVSPCLYVERDGRVIPLAYFRSQWAAEVARQILTPGVEADWEPAGEHSGIVSLRDRNGGPGGHQIDCDGLRIRVLPDHTTTARQRHRWISLDIAESQDGYGLVGRLVARGLNVQVEEA